VKRINLSFALAYLVLVVLPLLGLLGILRVGQTLTAPVSVGGLWRLHVNTDKTVAFPCGKVLALSDASFTISQSGRSFTLQFANSVISPASGSVEGTTIKANIAVAPNLIGETGCEEAHVLTLTAIVDSQINAKSLAGVLSVEPCIGCAPLEFSASLEGPAKASGGS
jgi:hypothetical protein